MNDPTDLELMMYADGELDAARAAEVARFLEGSAPAQGKLFGLSVLSLHVEKEADRVATAFSADDIVARVMKAVEAEGASEKKKHAASVVSIGAAKSKSLPAPANDNSRLIFALAGLAAAAAVALGVWGRGAGPTKASDDSTVVAASPQASMEPPKAAAVSGANDASPQMASNKNPPSPVQANTPESSTPAVAVAAVDFGTKTGAVYYVPSDTPGATATTVVWVTDE